MKKANVTELIIAILIPLAAGALSALFSGNSWEYYSTLARPPAAPPGELFPIVWTILYILMGISSYLVYSSPSPTEEKRSALRVYGIQLALNFLWSILFFRFELIGIAAIELALLVLAVIVMLSRFKRISPLSAYLNIPYLLWTLYALYLNIGVFIKN